MSGGLIPFPRGPRIPAPPGNPGGESRGIAPLGLEARARRFRKREGDSRGLRSDLEVWKSLTGEWRSSRGCLDSAWLACSLALLAPTALACLDSFGSMKMALLPLHCTTLVVHKALLPVPWLAWVPLGHCELRHRTNVVAVAVAVLATAVDRSLA